MLTQYFGFLIDLDKISCITPAVRDKSIAIGVEYSFSFQIEGVRHYVRSVGKEKETEEQVLTKCRSNRDYLVDMVKNRKV